MAEGKRRLRRQLRAARQTLEAHVIEAAGEAVVQHWRREPSLAGAGRVLLYASLPDELPTRPLFEYLRACGCEVLFPRCGEDGLLYARIDRWRDLVPGRLGILEPPRSREARPPHGAAPVLVPGLAFDRSGNRLGRGKAWYDRSFDEVDEPRLIGAGFALQVVESVPRDAWDRRVGALLTERGFTRLTRTA